MESKFVEIRKGDIIIFKGESNSACFTTIENKGTYFSPNKEGMSLKGISIPITKYEVFTYSGYEYLGKLEDEGIFKCTINRVKTGQACFINERDMQRYFSKPDDPIYFLENYRNDY